MLLIDAPGPAASQFMLERFRFADAPERLLVRFLNHADDPQSLFAVFLHPLGQVFKSGGIKLQGAFGLFQARFLCFAPWPPKDAFASLCSSANKRFLRWI